MQQKTTLSPAQKCMEKSVDTQIPCWEFHSSVPSPQMQFQGQMRQRVSKPTLTFKKENLVTFPVGTVRGQDFFWLTNMVKVKISFHRSPGFFNEVRCSHHFLQRPPASQPSCAFPPTSAFHPEDLGNSVEYQESKHLDLRSTVRHRHVHKLTPGCWVRISHWPREGKSLSAASF